jgi:hypothetical protein
VSIGRAPPVRLSALCRGARSEALAMARDALGDAGLFVTDVQLYSDLAACLTFEGEAPGLARLAARFELDAESLAGLEQGPSTGEVVGTLALTFAQGQGDLRHEKPAVPG